MKFSNLYKLFGLIALLIILQGRSSGPGTVAMLEVTGAPGSSGDQGTCANSGCHGNVAFNTALEVQFKSEIDESIPLEYIPGTTYLVAVQFTTDGTESRTGFQAVALDNNDANIGAWNNTLGTMQTVEINGREYLEQVSPVGVDRWGSFWIAPPAGSGDVTFYAAGLASNNDGSTTGDGVASNFLTISEAGASSVAQIDRNFASIRIAPNPIIDQANLTINSQVAGDFQMNILNLSGQKVFSENTFLQVGQNDENLNLGDLQSGLYFLQLIGEESMAIEQLIKL